MWTSWRRIALALGALALWAAAGGTGAAFGAASFSVTATPATPGAATASQPVKLAVRASLTASSGSPPPPLRRLLISLPDGFTTTLPAVASCVAPDFAARGSSACPAGSRLGAGGASFVYTSGPARIAASTDELVLFHGERTGGRSTLHLFARISKPVALSFSLPGTIDDRAAPAGPLVTFDLGGVAQPAAGGAISLASAAFDIEHGLVGGPCPALGWTFDARLEYVSGAVEQPRAQTPCSSTPDTTTPSLRVRARDGTPATGARFVLRLSEPATVRVALERLSGGRWRAVRRVSAPAREGSSTLRIRSIDERRLPRGRYRARLRALDAAGLASAKRNVTFRLR